LLMADIFRSYWWLLFPIGFFVFGAWDRWLSYQRSRDHLELLNQVFIGYRVTFVGSFIGFAYALVAGTVVGYCGAKVYNWIVSINQRQAGDSDAAQGKRA